MGHVGGKRIEPVGGSKILAELVEISVKTLGFTVHIYIYI